jgi:hypothetical protein
MAKIRLFPAQFQQSAGRMRRVADAPRIEEG